MASPEDKAVFKEAVEAIEGNCLTCRSSRFSFAKASVELPIRLAAKPRDAEADTSALEREIDELVYALYGLTPEGIKIVEGAAK